MGNSAFKKIIVTDENGEEVEVVKTLANCSAVDFLTQTNKIRKAVAKWLADTDIMNIRKHVPTAPEISKEMGQEEIEKKQKEYKKMLEQQSRKNLADMFDAVLDEHPQETLELLALICFLEPKDIEEVSGIELLNVGLDTINDEQVLHFFISLVHAANTITPLL